MLLKTVQAGDLLPLLMTLPETMTGEHVAMLTPTILLPNEPEVTTPLVDKADHSLLVRRLAEQLWKDPHTTHKQHRRLGIADPLASMVTVVWEATQETVEERFLERIVHRYFLFVRQLDRSLAQRPGLQLVLVTDVDHSPEWTCPCPDLKRDFFDSVQQLLRRIGEAALDLQLRWVEEKKGQTLSSHLAEILSAHGHIDTATSGPQPKTDTELMADLDTFNAQLSKVTAHAGPATLTLDLLAPLLSLDVSQLPEEVPVKQSPEVPLYQAPDLLLGVHLKARRFTQYPLWVDLGPVTLVASENATGKTTLVEAIAQLYLARPRVRALLPDRAEQFGHEPLLQALRFTSNPEAPPEAAQLLALFADDAELERGTLGEVALLSVLPLLSNQDKHTLFEIFDLSTRMVQRLRTAASDVLLPTPSPKNSDDGTSERTGNAALKGIWVKFLGLEVARVTIEVNKRQIPLAKQDAAEEDDRIKQKLGSTGNNRIDEKVVDPELKELEYLLNTLAPSADVAPAPTEISAEVLTRLEAFFTPFLRWLRLSDNLPTEWDALQPHFISRTPGVSQNLRVFLSSRLEDLASLIERRLCTYVENLERAVLGDTGRGQIDRLENELYYFLDVAVELPRSHRPNTARQVRRAFAARLARWLYATGGELPILIVDEPVLGQDASAAAAALGRFLRLRRIHEGQRWVRSLGQPMGQFLVLLDAQIPPGPPRVEQIHTGKTLPFQHSDTDTSSANPHWPPLPPQLILASHLSSTLVAAADSEGLVLDLAVQGQLRKLIPPEWMNTVRDVLSETSQVWSREQHARLLQDWKPLAAAALVRCWHTAGPHAVFRAIGDGKGWRTGALESLCKLQLFALHQQCEAESAAYAESLARRLLLWLIGMDLLPAILADGQAGYEVSGLVLRQLPASGGEALELGPSRLRRISPWLEILPPDPVLADESASTGETPPPNPIPTAEREREEGVGATSPPPTATGDKQPGVGEAQEEALTASAQASSAQASDGETPDVQSVPIVQSPDGSIAVIVPTPEEVLESETAPESSPAQAPVPALELEPPTALQKASTIALSFAEESEPESIPIPPIQEAPDRINVGPVLAGTANNQTGKGGTRDDKTASPDVGPSVSGRSPQRATAPVPPVTPSGSAIARVRIQCPPDTYASIENIVRGIGMLPGADDPAALTVTCDPTFEQIPLEAGPHTGFKRSIRLRGPGWNHHPLTFEYDQGRSSTPTETILTTFHRWLELRRAELQLALLTAYVHGLPRTLGTSDGEPLALALWTYIPDDTGGPDAHFTFGMSMDEIRRSSPLDRIEKLIQREVEGLNLLRQTLAGAGRRTLRLYPKCLPGMGIRAGFIFNHRTGFSLEVMQNDSPWDVDLQKVRVRPRVRREEIKVPETPPAPDSSQARSGVSTPGLSTEMHVLLSYAQSVRELYLRWHASQQNLRVRVALEFMPPEGPSRDGVARDEVTDLAELLVEQIIRARRSGEVVRFFVAIPLALAVALGRSMNALGVVSLMDFDRETLEYLETFRFRC